MTKILLVAPDTHGEPYSFDLLCWSRRLTQAENFEVELLDFDSSITVDVVRLPFSDQTAFSRPLLFKLGWLKSAILTRLKRRRNSVRKSLTQEFIFPAERNCRHATKVRHVNYTVSFAENFRSFKEAASKSRAVLKATDRHYGVACLKKLYVREVLVGDLLCSHLLHVDRQAGGRLRSAKVGRVRLFLALFAVVRAFGAIDRLGEQSRDSFLVVHSPELTYLQFSLVRYASKQGFKVLDTFWGRFELLAAPDGMNLPTRLRRTEDLRKKLASSSISDDLKAEDRWYSNFGDAPQDLALFNSLKPVASGRRVVVIPLHSFNDAQFFYGDDGFEDLFTWLEFTIEELGQKREIDGPFVLLKLHPYIHYRGPTSDAFALKMLRSIVDKYRNVRFAPFSSTWQELVFTQETVFVTHHGTLADEVACKGFNVVAAGVSRWGIQDQYIDFWESPDEYRDLLQKLTRVPLGLDESQVEAAHLMKKVRNLIDKETLLNWPFVSLGEGLPQPNLYDSWYRQNLKNLMALDGGSLRSAVEKFSIR